MTSGSSPKAREGQGPQPDLRQEGSEIFGELEERKRAVPGSPEHQLLKEAGALKPQGRRPEARNGAGDEVRDLSAKEEKQGKACRKERYGRDKDKKGIGDEVDPEPKKPGL